MNYKESNIILEVVKKAKKVLVSCHRGPDIDSVGSATAIAQVLEKMGKEVTIVCVSKIPVELKFLKKTAEINEGIDFASIKYSDFDLFICSDSSTWQTTADNLKVSRPKIPLVVIDHHETNDKFGDINLLDADITSVGELLYLVFEDWKIKLDNDIATSLLTGILGDTGILQYPEVTSSTFDVVRKLIIAGADKDKIILNVFGTYELDMLKFLGEMLDRTELDKDNMFLWSAVPHEIYAKYGKPANGKEIAGRLFMRSVKNTNFGVVMVEVEKEFMSVSLRSRTGFDISGIATKLGGGGHKASAGARIIGLSFENAVEKVLNTCRKYAKNN